MTVKQKQLQLYFLGYYTGKIDGLWGEKSKAATLAFQKDFFPDEIAWDGIFGPNTAEKSREVIDAIQDVVTRYAATPLVNDGLAGSKTMAATKAYQEAMGLPATGLAKAITRAAISSTVAPEPEKETESGDFWGDIEFFTREEFACPCPRCGGFPAEPNEILVRVADRVRGHFGSPADVSSGVRCQEHNDELPNSVPNSRHILGKAMDFRIRGKSAAEVLAYVQKQPEVRYAYAIDGSYVHMDVE